jgi:hypothetical protein
MLWEQIVSRIRNMVVKAIFSIEQHKQSKPGLQVRL